MNLNKITVRKKDIYMRECKACGTITAHVGKEDTVNAATGAPFSTCIQCFVDVVDAKAYSRWIDPFTGNRLTEPRGTK